MKNKINRNVILILVIFVFLTSFLVYMVTPKLRHIPEFESVSIYFYPAGYMNRQILIYDNDDKDFSEHIVHKIARARTELIDLGCKSTRCREGYYAVYIETKSKKLEYQVSEIGKVYDCQTHKNLICDLSSDIYLYLAIQKLDGVMLNEEDSEDYIRFSEDRFFRYLRN